MTLLVNGVAFRKAVLIILVALSGRPWESEGRFVSESEDEVSTSYTEHSAALESYVKYIIMLSPAALTVKDPGRLISILAQEQVSETDLEQGHAQIASVDGGHDGELPPLLILGGDIKNVSGPWVPKTWSALLLNQEKIKEVFRVIKADVNADDMNRTFRKNVTLRTLSMQRHVLSYPTSETGEYTDLWITSHKQYFHYLVLSRLSNATKYNVIVDRLPVTQGSQSYSAELRDVISGASLVSAGPPEVVVDDWGSRSTGGKGIYTGQSKDGIRAPVDGGWVTLVRFSRDIDSEDLLYCAPDGDNLFESVAKQTLQSRAQLAQSSMIATLQGLECIRDITWTKIVQLEPKILVTIREGLKDDLIKQLDCPASGSKVKPHAILQAAHEFKLTPPALMLTEGAGFVGSAFWKNNKDLTVLLKLSKNDCAVGLSKAGFAGTLDLLVMELLVLHFAGVLGSGVDTPKNLFSGPHGPAYLLFHPREDKKCGSANNKTGRPEQIVPNKPEKAPAVLVPDDWMCLLLPHTTKIALLNVIRKDLDLNGTIPRLFREGVTLAPFLLDDLQIGHKLNYPKSSVSEASSVPIMSYSERLLQLRWEALNKSSTCILSASVWPTSGKNMDSSDLGDRALPTATHVNLKGSLTIVREATSRTGSVVRLRKELEGFYVNGTRTAAWLTLVYLEYDSDTISRAYWSCALDRGSSELSRAHSTTGSQALGLSKKTSTTSQGLGLSRKTSTSQALGLSKMTSTMRQAPKDHVQTTSKQLGNIQEDESEDEWEWD